MLVEVVEEEVLLTAQQQVLVVLVAVALEAAQAMRLMAPQTQEAVVAVVHM